MSSILRAIRVLALLAVVVVSAEVAARIEDYFRDGTPFLANPSNFHDLLRYDAERGVLKGIPHARSTNWQLNNAGFQGPDIEKSPSPNIPRIIMLGSSETFGSLFESPGMSYPEQLERLLAPHKQIEIINAAIFGMSAKSTIPYYVHWVSQFKPDYVVVYLNPIFYLSNSPPSSDTPPKGPPRGVELRMFKRLRNRLMPAFLSEYRVKRRVEGARRSHDPEWVFKEAPDERVELFEKDVETLVRAILDSGATPILVIHATAIDDLDSPATQSIANMALDSIPRATPPVLLAFEKEANQRQRQIAEKYDVPYVDADEAMTGQRDLFGDFVHFNNAGATRMAEILADAILRLDRQQDK